PRCGAPYWSWSATRTSPLLPNPPSAQRAAHLSVSWCACPAGTTSRSWAVTGRLPRPNCPSCGATCSTRQRIAPATLPRVLRTEADGHERDRTIRGDDRVRGHRWRRPGSGAVARADDGRLTVGRTDRGPVCRSPVRGTDAAAGRAPSRGARRRRPVAAWHSPAGHRVP